MAVYKVPQDVEAEDKLLGPFSFKQMIFLFIAVGAGGLAYGLSRISMPLFLIPIPVMLFFGTLALPLRKDQPMEVYLAAIISFLLKPRVRLWQPDGIEGLIQITAPKIEDRVYGKGYSQEEVQRRLSYLSNIVDSRGWAVRGVADQNNPMRDDLFSEAISIEDTLDDGGIRAQQISDLLDQRDNQRRQDLMQRMQQPPIPPMSTPSQVAPVQAQPIMAPPFTPMMAVQPTAPDEDIKLVVNPYPKMNQSVIMPLSDQPVAVPQPAATVVAQPQANAQPQPSKETVSPAIIDLARNHDGLSIDTLQREAKRIKQKEEGEEVVISLR